jgi:hypothetical protein
MHQCYNFCQIFYGDDYLFCIQSCLLFAPKDTHKKKNQKKDKLVILIWDRVDFRTKNIIIDKIISFFFFFFCWDWSLNSGLHSYKTGTLLLEPCLQSRKSLHNNKGINLSGGHSLKCLCT